MDYEEHLSNLRKEYYEAYPGQRLHIGRQRIAYPENGPNQVVTYVSVIEGFLRSLVIWGETTSGKPSKKTYKKYEHWSVQKLFDEYLRQQRAEVTDIIPNNTYTLVVYAIKYRNLLAHECTYLGQDKYPDIIDACEVFLCGLAKHAGIKES